MPSPLKKILLTLAGLFLLYRSLELTKSLLVQHPANYSTVETIVLAYLLTLFITGVFALPGFAWPTHKLLPKKYYNIRYPKTINRMYKILGIKYFKWLLLLFFWGKKNNREKYFDGSRRGINNLLFQSKQSEFGHLGAFFVISIIVGFLLSEKYYLLVSFAMIINIIGNFYPVILQRHHRMRVAKLMLHKKFAGN